MCKQNRELQYRVWLQVALILACMRTYCVVSSLLVQESSVAWPNTQGDGCCMSKHLKHFYPRAGVGVAWTSVKKCRQSCTVWGRKLTRASRLVSLAVCLYEYRTSLTLWPRQQCGRWWVGREAGGGRKTKGIKEHKHKVKGMKKEWDKHTAAFDFLDQLDFYVHKPCSFSTHPTNATSRTALFWVITRPVVAIPYRGFGTTYRSHLQSFNHFKVGPTGCPETSARNYHYSLLDPCRWDRWIVPKRRQGITTTHCFLTPADGTDGLSRNVGTELTLLIASWPLQMGPMDCPETSARD